MKKIPLLLVLVYLIAGCSNSVTRLQERITGADSVAINYFKDDGTMDTVVAVKIIRDSASVQKLVDLVTAGTTTFKPACAYNGSLHFFKNDFVVQDIFFSSKNECRQFSFSDGGKKNATDLSADAKALLETLQSKK